MYSISRTPTRTLERETQSLLEGPEAGDTFSGHCHLFPSFPLFLKIIFAIANNRAIILFIFLDYN